jgi:hypothetical protein
MKQIEFDFFNVGGIQKIYAIPQSSLFSIREDKTSGLYFLELVSLENIIDIYTIFDTVVFTEDATRDSAGVSYEVSITGIIPKSNLLNQVQLRTLENEPFYYLFMDNNDQIRLAGTDENQHTFTRRDTSGTLSSRNQIQFEIKGKQTIPCYFIDNQIFDDF